MTLEQIKQAVDEGKVVHWISLAYTVIKDNHGEYLIKSSLGSPSYIGLTWADEKTINGNEKDFYIS